jgi:hypothetical protein
MVICVLALTLALALALSVFAMRDVVLFEALDGACPF